MITEREFLDAVDIVKKYRNQINQICDNATSIKTITLGDFIDKYNEILLRTDVRTYNCLKGATHLHDKPVAYIEVYDLMKLRNFGKMSLMIFKSIAKDKFVEVSKTLYDNPYR